MWADHDIDFISAQNNFTLRIDSFQYITNIGSKAIFRTNRNAPNYRLISIDLKEPGEKKCISVIDENEKDVLHWAHIVDGNKLVVGYLHDVKVFHFWMKRKSENDKFTSSFFIERIASTWPRYWQIVTRTAIGDWPSICFQQWWIQSVLLFWIILNPG